MPLCSHKTTHYLWSTAKIVVAAGVLWFLVSKLGDTQAVFASVDVGALSRKHNLYLYIAILLLLFIGNWFLEVVKWYMLVRKVHPFALKTAFTQVLASHSIALLTPAKIGEYGAKILYVAPDKRNGILLQNLKGNAAQLIATLAAGMLGGLYVVWYVVPRFFTLACIIAIVAACTGLFALKHRRRFQIPRGILWLSAGRYVLFAHQLFLLLRLFDVTTPYVLCMSLIGLTYLVSSLIPILQIFDVVLRASAGIWAFGLAGILPQPVLLATTSLWLLNVGLPAVVGIYYVLRFKQTAPSHKEPIVL